MRYQRPLINCLAVILGSCIAVSLYSTLHADFSLTRSNIALLQDGNLINFENRKPTVKMSKDSIKALAEKAMQRKAKELADSGGFVAFANDDPELMFRRNPSFTPSTCPNSLQKKLTSVSWAKDLYHPEVIQVMHPGALNTSEYERLLPYWMPYGYKYHEELKYEASKGHVYDDLKEILSHFSQEMGYFEFSDKTPECVSCAVVGNGGVMKGSGKGKEIDGHDMVFRVNNALRKGFEEDVGSRTTYYVLMDRSLIHMPKDQVPRDEGLKYLFLPCRLKDYYYIRDVVAGANPKQKLTADPNSVRIFHPDFIRYFQKMWMVTKSFRPSTGAVMFFAALHGGCDEISVYGMGFNAQYSEHYYDKEYQKYTNFRGSHDFQKEIKILKDLHRDGIITWYTRDIEEFKS